MTWINQLINDADDSKWFMQFVLKKNFFIIDDSGKKSVQLSMIKTVEECILYVRIGIAHACEVGFVYAVSFCSTIR